MQQSFGKEAIRVLEVLLPAIWMHTNRASVETIKVLTVEFCQNIGM